MLKFVLTALFLGLLICLLYHPLSLPDDESLIDKYRPSFRHQPIDNAAQSTKKTLKIVIQNINPDSINSKKSQILVDSTP